MFDAPTLRHANSQGAAAFLEILELRTHRAENPPTDPLGIAATGLLQVFSDRATDGLRRFRELTEVDGDEPQPRLTRLLGLALTAWNDPANTEVLDEAVAQALELDDGHLVALYLLKLAGFAYEAANRDLARQLVLEARGRLPDGYERLAWRLTDLAERWEGITTFSQANPRSEALADFPWIESNASGAARKALVKSAESDAASPWRRTIHFGTTPLDAAAAAVLQAEWAGAWWMLSRLRLQHAATALVQGARDTGEWERAAANWVLGGGTHVKDVLDKVEAHFGPDSASVLVHEHLLDGRRLEGTDRYIEVVVAMWDLLREDIAIGFLQEREPEPGDSGARDSMRFLWAVLGAVVPTVWTERLTQLRTDQQASLLTSVTPTLLRRLPSEATAILAARCIDELSPASDNIESASSPATANTPEPELFEAAVRLLRSPHIESKAQERLMEVLGRAPESYRLELATEAPELAAVFDVASLMEQELNRVQAQAERARVGQYSMFRRSPMVVVGGAAHTFPVLSASAEIATELVGLAFDQQLVASFRSDALQALYLLAEGHRFDRVLAERVLHETAFHDDPFGDGSEVVFQQGLLDGARFIANRGAEGLPSILARTRDMDSRVRNFAIRAIGNVLHLTDPAVYEERVLLWHSIAGSLFDPEPSVVRRGIAVLVEAPSIPPVLSEVITQRLMQLYSESDRSVRAVVAMLALRLIRTRVFNLPGLQQLVTAAAADRSWLVRDAVATADLPTSS